jgi:hypothetical protein
VLKRQLGHVDNSSFPEVTVEMQLTLATPANAKGPVPVILERLPELVGRGRS